MYSNATEAPSLKKLPPPNSSHTTTMTKYATGRLSEFEKGEIIALHKSKQTLAQIAAQVN